MPKAITVDHGTEFTSKGLGQGALRLDYNHRRSHGSLGNLTPSEFAERVEEGASGAAAWK